MNTKISLILLGLLVTLAVLTTAENSEENSLSEEVASSRLARFAEEDAGKKKKKNKKAKKAKKSKKNKKAKKAKKSNKNAGKRKNKGERKNKKKNKTSKKDKKRKNKTSKKNKRKNKSLKKNKKSRKAAKKGKKSKKSRSNKKNKSNKKQKERSGRSVDGTCLESAMTAMNRWRGVVTNFKKQKTRIEKQSEIAGKKGAKKAVFAPIALKLVDLGGGNKSALTCSGSADSEGAKQLTNLTKTLFDCEVMVNKSCSMDFPAPNMTFVDQCTMDIEMFETKTEECYKISKADTASEACTCWTDADFAKIGNKIKSCKIAETSDVAKGLKACRDAFSTCRQYEDAAVASMAACSVSADKLKAKAAALSANVDATKEAAAKVAKVTGSSSSSRAAATTCAEFITLVNNMVTILNSFPASPQVITVAKYIKDSADPTCTTAEKATLVSSESSLNEAQESLVEALDEAQATLEAATGSTLSASELLEFTATAAATTKASRYRMRGFQRQQLFGH